MSTGATSASRHAGIDLMRPLLMVFVVANHLVWHGVGLDDLQGAGLAGGGAGGFVKLWMFPLVVVAVDCYVLISGFFGIRFRSSSLAFLVLQGFVYSAVVAAIGTLFRAGPPVLGLMQYWFLLAYLGVAILAPYVNPMLERLDDRRLAVFLAIGFAFDCGVAFFYTHEGTFGINFGFSIWHLLFMYCLGRGLARWNPVTSPWMALAGYLLASAATGAIATALYSTGRSDAAYRFLVGNSPLVVLAAVFLFQFFRHFPFRIALPSIVTGHVFGTYLLHTNRTIYDPWIAGRVGSFVAGAPERLLWSVPVASIAVFLVCLPISVILDAAIRAVLSRPAVASLFGRLDADLFPPAREPKP